MAKKKPNPRGKPDGPGPGRPGRRKSRKLPPELPDDPRVVEAVFRQLFGELADPRAAQTPQGRAQTLVDRAAGEQEPQKRLALAREALELWPDCADAYVLLAEQAHSRKEALEIYEQAVAAGERALGPETFREAAGHFWGLLETRPYMRARHGLADSLWTTGRRDEAVGHLREMLRLNPSDNQGVRYVLAAWLLLMDQDQALADLLDQYPNEGSATWDFSRALLAYRRGGDSPEARKFLARALRTNEHVPTLLLGREPIPPTLPSSYSPGAPSEATIYAASFLGGWKSSPGALAWLREIAEGPRKPPRSAPNWKGPTTVSRTRLSKLPQDFDEWQADFRMLAHWVEVAGQRVRPWVILIVSSTRGLILAHEISEQAPPVGDIWKALQKAMSKPAAGGPLRPIRLLVHSDPLWEELKPHLEELGIEVQETDDLDNVDHAFADLTRFLAGDSPPGLLEMPGITPEQVESFYQAAASFYRRAPWKSLGYEAAIQIESEKYQSGPWFAVVMGQSGLTIGLALYEDLNLLRRMWAGKLSDEESARLTVGLTVTFDAETDLPAVDVDAAQRHGWEVAGPEAYPLIFRKERGMSMRPPLAWELELMEGCLRALPEFVSHHPPGTPARTALTVPTAAGELPLVLSWVEEE